jgi:hypothetical protein
MLNHPKRAVETNPAPGTWTVLVSGFEIHASDDRFRLRVTLDGNVVK